MDDVVTGPCRLRGGGSKVAECSDDQFDFQQAASEVLEAEERVVDMHRAAIAVRMGVGVVWCVVRMVCVAQMEQASIAEEERMMKDIDNEEYDVEGMCMCHHTRPPCSLACLQCMPSALMPSWQRRSSNCPRCEVCLHASVTMVGCTSGAHACR
jgi:hypothetical protein